MPTKIQEKLTIPNSKFDPDDYFQTSCGDKVRVIARYYSFEFQTWSYKIFGSIFRSPEDLKAPPRKKGRKTLTIPKPKINHYARHQGRWVRIVERLFDPEKNEWGYILEGRATPTWESQLKG